MFISPLREIEKEIVFSIKSGKIIRTVLIGSDLWFGFLLQLDLPYTTERLRELKKLDGHPIVKEYMDILEKAQGYDDEHPFYFKHNPHVQGVRVSVYPKSQ